MDALYDYGHEDDIIVNLVHDECVCANLSDK